MFEAFKSNLSKGCLDPFPRSNSLEIMQTSTCTLLLLDQSSIGTCTASSYNLENNDL